MRRLQHKSIVSGISAVSQFAFVPFSTVEQQQQALAFTPESRAASKTAMMSSADNCAWENISFKELTVCENIGGGGVALVHRGFYRKQPVALKTLVHIQWHFGCV